MKFGSKFRSYAVPEWQRHYVDYQCLKGLLKQQRKKLNACDAPPAGYLFKLLPARWQLLCPRCVCLLPALPLPAAMGPPSSRLAPTPGEGPTLRNPRDPPEQTGGPRWSSSRKPGKGRGDSALGEPLLQQPQLQLEQQQLPAEGGAAGEGAAHGGSAAGQEGSAMEALRAECVKDFAAAVETEKTKVAVFFKEELGFLKDKLEAVQAELDAFNAARRRRPPLKGNADNAGSLSGSEGEKRGAAGAAPAAPAAATAAKKQEETAISSEDAAYLRRLERILLLLLDTLNKLEVYRRLNLLALWKALKKRDKQLELRPGQAVEDFESITAFFKQELHISPKTRRVALKLYRQVAGKDSDLPLDVFSLRAAEGLSMGQFHREGRVWFLAGCLAVLLLLTMTLLSLPMPPSTSFDYGGLMAVFPLFRLAFSWSFVWLSTASAMAIMERYGVNYRFLLDLPPRGQTSSISFFSFAALHFVATTGTVVLYLADSKLHLLGDHQMYHVYPLGLLLLQLIFLVFPSRALSYKSRRQVLAVFISVLKAGVFAVGDVKLVANILGDVLTSLAKPLGDLQYLLCYLRSMLESSYGEVTDWSNRLLRLSAGDALFRPLLLGLPFYLRLCQCFIRFRGSEPGGGLIHLMNMSKYACGILVLITTNVPWLDLGISVYAMCLLWVFSYALGSLFMLYWDVRVDWGLLPTPDRFVRMQGRLMYPPWLYGAIAVTNVMGRLTWAMTLMPISIVGNKSLSGNLVLLFISVIEILRRGALLSTHSSIRAQPAAARGSRLTCEELEGLLLTRECLGQMRILATAQVPPLHQTRLEMLDGDPLMQTSTPAVTSLASGASFQGAQQESEILEPPSAAAGLP
ncbi:hypothetical protein Efla_002833 [Eimeria flavescens]